MSLIRIIALSILATNAFSQEIFVLKKNYNPRNVLHFQAKVEACKLRGITNHWIMGESGGYKEELTSSEKAYFQTRVTYSRDTELDFTMGALEEMGNRVDNTIRVRLVNCLPKAYIDINRQEIELSEIYAVVGLLMNVKSLTITGKSPSGQVITHRINN